MGRVYMIRHGKPKSVWGQSSDEDPGLDEQGITQAEAARDRLLSISGPFRPRFVIASPLRRCRETAEPFARALGVPVEIDPLFGEIPTPPDLPHEARPDWLKRAFTGRWDEIEGGFDYPAWRRAIVSGLAAREGAAIFSHFVAINAAVSAVLDDERVLAFRPDHASITCFGIEADALSLLERGREAETRVL